MKILILIFFVINCSCALKKNEEALVSLPIALDQAQSSYLKGCVDGLKKINIPLVFNGCRDLSLIHRKELENFIMSEEIQN